MALKGKLVRFSTTQSMDVDKLLKNQNDIQVETKDVMSKKVDKRFEGQLKCAPRWGPNREANLESHVQTQYVFVKPNNHFGM